MFSKVIALAPKNGNRIVAISRRDYPGSSPLGQDDIRLMLGSGEDKAQYLEKRGLEYLKFTDAFIQQHSLPAPTISEGNATTGGISIAGWSLGNSSGLAAVASISKLESGSRARISRYLRCLIFEDPPVVALGEPLPETAWNPFLDPQIPEGERARFLVAWLTSYFDHPGLSSRNIDDLTYALPSTRRVPSIYTMHDHYDELVCLPPILVGEEDKSLPGSDTLLIGLLGAQLKTNYEKVEFGEDVKALLPNVTMRYFGTHSALFCVAAFWKVQDDVKKRGGLVELEMSDHGHFIHWNEPEAALESWKNAL
ncbi:hypothetical protein FA13DRAFT_1731453, partial [Coprinellus micaceus]